VNAQFITEDAAPASSLIWFNIILVVSGRIKLPISDVGINDIINMVGLKLPVINIATPLIAIIIYAILIYGILL
jgi:hypothetical protein